MQVVIDDEKCQGHGRCYALAPTVFDPDDLGQGTVLNEGAVAAEDEEKARLAAANCPELAITVVEEG
jgi:ferredoxin